MSDSSDEEEKSDNDALMIVGETKSREVTANTKLPSVPDVSEDTNEIILSIIWTKNKVGAAYYNIVTSELFVMEDTTDDAEHLNVTKSLCRQCQPRYVITIAGMPACLTNALKKMAIAVAITDMEQGDSNFFDSSISTRMRNVALKIMCKKEHSFDRCFHRVRCLRLEFEPKSTSNANRLSFLNSLLNFNCSAMIHALGSLLLFVDRHWNSIALDLAGKPCFASLSYIALKALHQPSRNITMLEQRLNVIEFFLNPDNQAMVEHLSCSLRHIYRLTNTILACCSGSQATIANWFKLYKSVSHVISIADLCEDYAERIDLFKRIAKCVTNEMQYVKYFIEYIVDFGASRQERKLVVKPNVDPLLDELNYVRRTLPELLTRMGEKDMREHLPASVTGCNMLYLPSIGYVLAINKWNPTPAADITFPDLEFKFSINDVHYYKSSSARELDESVGDIMLKIAIRENRILEKLTRYVKKHTGPILHAIELCAELDTLLAFYKVARDYNYTRPTMTESKVIDVKEGRHPLLECWTTFISNDIRSGNGSSLIKVLTGPNCCGKSVYLKEIGLVIFMAHIGSYVPAKSAIIGTVSHIFAQMSTTESIGLSASSFLQNLRQINVALGASTPHSVVITDELDRGTSEVSGLSLVAAVLSTFAERGSECPHVFAATHAHSVLALLPRTWLIEAQTFEYVVNEDESLAFLHRLVSGGTTRSYAHFIAKIADLDKTVVTRSLEVLEKMKQTALPSSIHRRTDALKRIIELSKKSDRIDDLEAAKLLIRKAIIAE